MPERAIGYVRIPLSRSRPRVLNTEVDRLRTHCLGRGWDFVACVRAVPRHALEQLLGAVAHHGCECVVMTAETVADLERDDAALWARTRRHLDARGVTVVTV